MAICSEPKTFPLLVAIHDVTPHTLHLADSILEELLRAGIEKITMLIVPGLAWTHGELNRLKHYQTMGVSLAGHGWRHTCVPERALHRLHSRLFSRNAAEHLSLQPSRIEGLIRDCYGWFKQNGLRSPQLYVPPAWAMGGVPASSYRHLPFRFYETLSGVHDATRGILKRLPLLGFEADTRVRKRILNFTNHLNLAWARGCELPARLAIHPLDFKLKLSQELALILRSCPKTIGYDDDRLWHASLPRRKPG